jgi:transcriptional regulator PpsR
MIKGRHDDGLKLLASESLASRIVSSATDVALALDRQGKILEVSLGDWIESHPGWKKLAGKQWVDTVSIDSRGKVEQLMGEAHGGQTTRSREINQEVDGLGEVPLRCAGVAIDELKRVLVLGRDLRPLANLQQRMVSTQQALERDYGRLRDADTRYRVLFHVSLEGVLVADATTRRVLEANPSAASMLGEPAAAIQGKLLQDFFELRSWAKVQALLAGVEAGAKPADIRVNLKGQTEAEMTLSGLLFRQAGAALVLLRMWSANSASGSVAARASRMLAMLDAMPEGFVVTGEDRRILSANGAFCELVQQANENQVLGELLDRWLGRPGVDMNIILASLREHRAVRNFATVVRGDYGSPQEALVTAVSALDGKVPCIGFTIRAASSRLASVPNSTVMPRSVSQLRELVGRVPLKDLVRESADLIERLCIEAALEVSGNNRASAAQLLGLSRQGLYSKLRRHGIAEFGPA